MGGVMARNLLGAGFAVVGFDVADAARQRLAADGGTPVEDLARVAGEAAVVILMLPDSNVVERVVRDPGFLGALAPGLVVVDMSSSEPLRTRQLAAELGHLSVALLDAPVSGGVRGAEAATLTIMAGGDAEQVARVRDVLTALGKVTHVGPVGAGHALKALNNLLSATHLLATGEAMLAGERFGLDPNTMLAVFNASSGRSGSTEAKWPNFVLPHRYDSGFGLRLMLKDVKVAVDLIERLGCPNELGASAAKLWASAAEGLAADADHTEIARWLQDRAARPVDPQPQAEDTRSSS
jgi:3-hydroxyisobutyrate dehydrogenase